MLLVRFPVDWEKDVVQFFRQLRGSDERRRVDLAQCQTSQTFNYPQHACDFYACFSSHSAQFGQSIFPSFFLNQAMITGPEKIVTQLLS